MTSPLGVRCREGYVLVSRLAADRGERDAITLTTVVAVQSEDGVECPGKVPD